MSRANESIWGSINTLFETGLEIYRLMQKNGGPKATDKDTAVEKITDGVLLMSNDKETVIAVSKDTARQALSETAKAIGD